MTIPTQENTLFTLQPKKVIELQLKANATKSAKFEEKLRANIAMLMVTKEHWANNLHKIGA